MNVCYLISYEVIRIKQSVKQKSEIMYNVQSMK